MGDEVYRPLIEEMEWSYSRLTTFEDCPYRFFLKYIHSPKVRKTKQFYASYGSFIHKLIEKYYTGELDKEDLTTEFLSGFSSKVEGERPSKKIVQNYIDKGVRYFDNFEEFKYPLVDVEKRIKFKVGDARFVGILDYIGDDNGDLVIIDNKSRELKPRSKRKKPTRKDEELDEMLKQLYIYASAVEQEYGKLPTKLCFNCFKNGEFIEEEFDEEAYKNSIEWAKSVIQDIKEEEDFNTNGEYFVCNNLCDVRDECMYYSMGAW